MHGSLVFLSCHNLQNGIYHRFLERNEWEANDGLGFGIVSLGELGGIGIDTRGSKGNPRLELGEILVDKIQY